MINWLEKSNLFFIIEIESDIITVKNIPIIMDGLENKLAILIDADNTPYKSIEKILDYSHKFGNTIIKRAYGDWSTSALKEWNAIFREYAVKPMQQYQFTKGKNSTDIAMVIDAMDILHSKFVETFILVTSDSDFTGLAIRIRENGLKVIGIGRKTAPASFVKGCEEFIFIENLVPSPPEKVEKVALPNSQTIEGKITEGQELLRKAVMNTVDENGHVLGSSLGTMLLKLDPSFSPKNFGCRNLSKFIDLYPSVLQNDNNKSEKVKKYKVVDPDLI